MKIDFSLKNFLLYCGLNKEEYDSIKIEAYRTNFKIWKVLNLIVFIVGFASLITAFITDENWLTKGTRIFLGIYGLVMTILFYKVFKPESLLAQILIYITMGVVLSSGLIISIQEPTFPAVTFIAFLLILPMFMMDKPYYVFLFQGIGVTVYLVVAFNIKSDTALTSDVTNCVIFGIMGLVANVFNSSIRVKEYLLAKTLDKERGDVIRQQKSELETKTIELEEALTVANEASRAKTAFLFNMSHDIRTPMNAIMGFTDLAIKNIDNKEKALDCLKKTKDSSNHLLNLINDILDMSRIESGKMELSESPIDILNIIDNQVPMLKTLADKKEITLNVNIEELSTKYVYADHLRLNQALINIVSNAVKYTQERGTVNYDIYETECDKDGYIMLNFKVEDNGCGMEKDYIPTIFEEFSREKTSTVTKQQGTGLGLAITKRIVDMMKGTINVESEIGVGSTFTLSIPFKVQENPEIEDLVLIDDSLNKDDILANKKCLLVEDNELNREISTEILQDVGLIVDTAEDGSIAVEKVKENGANYYDFILMDIQMPVMDGYQATAELRKLFPDVHIPIIALSANAFEEDKRKSLDAGMDDHQSKPIVISLLVESIKKLLAIKR